MSEWYYTNEIREQQGPVEGDELIRLNDEGKINAESLVWKKGFEDWVSFSTVAAPLFGTDEDGIPMEIGVCAYSKRIYLVSEMVAYGEALIGVEHKDGFVQQLMETGETGLADATEVPTSFVGFWWRVLSSLLDYLIKMVPSSLCMVPYYAVAFTSGSSLDSDDASTGQIAALVIAYAVGLLGMLAISIFYETWMVAKYQGTLGKIVIGAKVVNPDGSRLTYGRAFIRWLAKKPLNYVIVWIPSTIGFALIMGLGVGAAANADRPGMAVASVFGGMLLYCMLLVLFSGVYWMAAFDAEKRTLHDRVAKTRVMKR